MVALPRVLQNLFAQVLVDHVLVRIDAIGARGARHSIDVNEVIVGPETVIEREGFLLPRGRVSDDSGGAIL